MDGCGPAVVLRACVWRWVGVFGVAPRSRFWLRWGYLDGLQSGQRGRSTHPSMIFSCQMGWGPSTGRQTGDETDGWMGWRQGLGSGPGEGGGVWKKKVGK